MFIWQSAVFILAPLLVLSFDKFGENCNSCIDTCPQSFDLQYTVDLNQGVHEVRDSGLIEILDDIQSAGDYQCSKNVLLRIPFYKLSSGTIVKLELDLEDSKGTTFHVGNSPTNDLYGGDRNSTIFNAEIYSNDSSLNYYLSSVNLCDQGVAPDPSIDISSLLYLNESNSFLTPQSKMIIYVSEKWFRVDNLEKKTSFYYNSDYLFTFRKPQLTERCKANPFYDYPLNRPSPYLYIGLNRVIADSKLAAGSGLCGAKISMLNCNLNSEPDLDVNVQEEKFNHIDKDNIVWTHPLGHSEPASPISQHPACSAQGVVKVVFDKNNYKKIARFDLELGEIISGFTFNIGDSPTNNGYGGDSGSTSNSAEMHSNDNRFYVWMNTKYCGETLLHKIEYSVFQSNDKITIFVSDERIEIMNNRDYHEIMRNPYLFNLNGQNVTCNCFDTRCYPGVVPDTEIYFGINRVIGGTYRPGFGLCNAKISWLQCKIDVRTSITKIDYDYVDWYNQTNVESTSAESSMSTKISTANTTLSNTEETNTSKATVTSTAIAEETTVTGQDEASSTSRAAIVIDADEKLSSTSKITPTEGTTASAVTANLITLVFESAASNTSVSEEVASTSSVAATIDLLELLKNSTAQDTTSEESTEDKRKRNARGAIGRPSFGKFEKGTPLVIHQTVTVLNGSLADAVGAIKAERKKNL